MNENCSRVLMHQLDFYYIILAYICHKLWSNKVCVRVSVCMTNCAILY